MKKHIVIISPFQFRLVRGVEKFIYCLANQLIKKNNIKITLYVWNTPNKINWGIWDSNIEFKLVPCSKYFQAFIATIYYKIWSFWNHADAYLINFLYHGETILPKKSKIYYVLHSPASLISHRYKFIEREYLKYKNLTFISVSEFVKKASESYLNSEKNIVIHHGLDYSKINRKNNYAVDGKLKILTIAALESWKGIQHVISLFSDNKIKQNFEYHIVGEGPFYDELYHQIIKLNAEKSIFLLGRKSDVESLYCNYDIYCQLSEGEAFGLSVIEAMGAGLPTIVYDLSPFDLLFMSEEVIKIKKNSEDHLKYQLLDLQSIDKRKKFGLRGQKYVLDTFTIEKMVDSYHDLLNG